VANSSSFRIDLQCPQCGAPAELEETQHIVDCPFCRVRHLVQNDPQLTAYIPPKTDIQESELCFMPYWRFKGTAFAFDRTRVRNRVIDTSSLAVNVSGLPHSLGLRSQTQTLRFVTPETPGRFTVPQLPGKELRARLSARHLGQGSRSSPPLVQSHVGEILSLIFAPFAVNSRGAFDGLTGRRIPGTDPADLLAAESCPPPSACSFRPCLCPHCGWDLDGGPDSHVLGCTGCRTMWICHQTCFVNISVAMAASSAADLWLPFWQFQVRASNMALKTRADLIRLANLPQTVSKEDGTTDLWIRVPAFRIQPALFLRLSRQLTVCDLSTQTWADPEAKSLHPANLPLQEGFQAIPPLICDLAWDKESIESLLQGCRLRPSKSELVALPFAEHRSEFVQPELKIAFLKSALNLGRML